MSTASDKADLIQAPFAAADSTGFAGVFRTASVSAAASVAVPTRYAGKYIRIKARGTSMQVAFAATAATLVADQASTIGTGHAAAGYTLADGEAIDVIVPKTAAYLCYVPVIGSGRLEGFISEAPTA